MNRSPSFRPTRTATVLSLAFVAVALSGCSSSTGGSGGSGGGAAGGGATSAGGTRGEGGTMDAGGSIAGSGGSSVVSGTGGIVGTGGTTATSAGSTGGAGSSGGGGTHSDGGSSSTGGKGAGGAGSGGNTSSAGGSMSTGGTTGGVSGNGGTSGAGGGSGGSGIDGGISGYRPCPTNGDPCRILPLGDSITFGFTFNGDTFTGGYRVKLFANAVAAHQKVTFTGSQTNGPDTVSGVTFPKHHEGHGGWRIAQLTPLIPSPAFDTAGGGIPHIILLHIGTNDTCCTGVTTMLNNLGTLIDTITKAAPDALLVVAKIIPMADPGYASVVKPYNAGIPNVVSARAAAGKHVVMIDMNTDFPMTDLQADGVHPTKAGYELMADRWYAAIGSLLPM